LEKLCFSRCTVVRQEMILLNSATGLKRKWPTLAYRPLGSSHFPPKVSIREAYPCVVTKEVLEIQTRSRNHITGIYLSFTLIFIIHMFQLAVELIHTGSLDDFIFSLSSKAYISKSTRFS
jgi:hypothetical protein